MIVFVSRLILVAVFALAGCAKLARRAQTEATLDAFGVSAVLRRPLAFTLPLVELAVAAALLPAASAPFAGVAALLLLAVFSFFVAKVLVRGEAVDCNCFGSLGSSRISRWTLIRNLALLVPAAIVAGAGWSDPGPSAVAWVGGLDTGEQVLGAIVVFLAVAVAVNSAFMFQLLRQNGRLWHELDALRATAPPPETPAGRIGQLAPGFALPDLDGEIVELDDLLEGGRGVALLFSDPRCSACADLYPLVGRLQRDPDVDPRPVLLGLGVAEDHRATAAEHGIERVLLHPDSRLPRELGVAGTPGLVVLDRDGRFAREPMLGPLAVSEFLTGSGFSHSTHADLEVTR